ncbi:MAG: 2,3-bisphosphoglycerate-independent phosphoglycerate mutase [Actinobacteria bacterium]|nr:2,3-bisphosphoglycerate-independent phosphoglycerate mutase [Actinomycetota bacterium]
MKVLMIILDGMADRSQSALGRRTPLQAAEIPNLDLLAEAGACGHMYPIAPGICPSSDMALWRMFGYGSLPFPGRAAIEALGEDMELEPGDVVIRLNLASTTVENGNRYVQIAPAYLPDDQAESIAGSLSGYQPDHFEVTLYHPGGPFIIMVLKGGASACVSDSDPIFYQLPVPDIKPLAGSSIEAVKTAEELANFLDWAGETLISHPVNEARAEEGMTQINFVLSKWPSVYQEVPAFIDRWGFDGLIIASGVLYKGFAKYFGMDFQRVTMDDDYEDMRMKIEAAVRALEDRHDFIFIHTKAPDEAGHTGKPQKKVSSIDKLDAALSPVVEKLVNDPEILTVVTADHTTPSGGSPDVMHSGESVPVVMTGQNVRVDNVTVFDEISCVGGSLGQITGSDLMPLILNFTDRARFGGSRLLEADLPYRVPGIEC